VNRSLSDLKFYKNEIRPFFGLIHAIPKNRNFSEVLWIGLVRFDGNGLSERPDFRESNKKGWTCYHTDIIPLTRRGNTTNKSFHSSLNVSPIVVKLGQLHSEN